MRHIVQFGAGNIGRSLVGTLFTQAGYEVVFVDASPEIVTALNTRRCYTVRIKDNECPDGVAQTVSNVRGILATDAQAVREAVAEAALVSTAVGARILPEIMPLLASGLARRTEPLTVLLCENLHGAGAIARQHLLAALPEERRERTEVRFAETSIGKMVPIMPEAVRKNDPLEVWAEAYNCIIADRAGFGATMPKIEGLLLKDQFPAWVERKLFVHNLGHATCAWHGHMHGYTRICDCLQDPWIHGETRAVMQTSAKALALRHPGVFASEDLDGHINDLLCRFTNRALADTIFRVGRDLPRKLAAGDRVMGALRLCIEQGVDPEHLCRAMAAALNFHATGEDGRPLMEDRILLERIAQEGIWPVLTGVCGLSPQGDGGILERILSRYTALCPA